MRVCVGGTFHPFHGGHEALLYEAARDATHLFVGITEGDLSHRDERDVPDWSVRAVAVEALLRSHGYEGDLAISPLRDRMGPAATGDYDAIAVSWETRGGADAINAARVAAGLTTLAVRVVPPVLAQDLLPISATRVAAGDIDDDGRRLTSIRVAVGSANPVKVAGVEAAIADVTRCPVAVHGHAVPSGVPEQPTGDETLAGARNRARAALAAQPGAEYAIGVEAGLQSDGDGWFDVQCCVVLDATGHETRGWGPGFQYPDWVTARAHTGEMISSIVGPVANDERIGGTTGAIGYLTRGALDRTALTRSAVLMAFVPRIRRGLYAVAPPGRAQ